jgi:hypothetical protein
MATPVPLPPPECPEGQMYDSDLMRCVPEPSAPPAPPRQGIKRPREEGGRRRKTKKSKSVKRKAARRKTRGRK